MKTLERRDEIIGIAITEEEMTLTLRALTISLAVLSLIDRLGLTTGITESSIKWLTELDKDYRGIYEDYKEKNKESEFVSEI